MITVRCSCGKDVTVMDSFAGKTAQCPHCRRQIQIPAKSGPAPQPSGPPAQAAAPPQRPAPPRPAPQAPAPQPAPTAPFPQPAYRQPAPPYAAAPQYRPAPAAYPAPPAPPKRRPGNLRIILCCAVLLLTAVVPWNVMQGKWSWSWDFLRVAPDNVLMFFIGAWVAAAVILILGIFLRGVAFAVPLLLLSGAAMVLMVLGWDNLGVAGLLELAGSTLKGSEALRPVALVAAAALFVAAAMRGHAGANVALGIIEALVAAAALTFVAILLVPTLREFVQAVENTSFGTFFKTGGIVPLTVVAGMALVVFAGLIALIHGLAVRSAARLPSRAAAYLVNLAAGVIMGGMVAAPLIAEQYNAGLFVAITLIVYSTMPGLALSGLARVVGGVAALAGRPKSGLSPAR